MTVGVLAAFEPIYTRMGGLGWSPHEVDLMEVPVVARFMGDSESGFDPVIRGSRGLVLPGDQDGSPSAAKSKLARMAKRAGGRASRVFRGEAAK